MCLYKVTMISMLIVHHDNSTFTGESTSVFFPLNNTTVLHFPATAFPIIFTLLQEMMIKTVSIPLAVGLLRNVRETSFGIISCWWNCFHTNCRRIVCWYNMQEWWGTYVYDTPTQNLCNILSVRDYVRKGCFLPHLIIAWPHTNLSQKYGITVL